MSETKKTTSRGISLAWRLLAVGAFLCFWLNPAWAFKAGDKIEVLWSGVWYQAKVVKVGAGKFLISYEGYDSSWDEWVGPDRIRAKAVAPESKDGQPTTPANIPDWKTMTREQIQALSAQPEIRPDPKAAKRRAELGFDFKVDDRVQVLWFGWWTNARIVKKEGDKYFVRLDESNHGFDQWVGVDRLRYVLWKDTFIAKPTKPNLSIIDERFQSPTSGGLDPALTEVQGTLRDLAKRQARLAEELGKLPDLQDGVTPKEKAGLKALIDLSGRQPKLMEKTFEAMDQIGLPMTRRYNAPLQALFWIAQNNPAALEKLVGNYSLSALLGQAWNYNQAHLWKDLDLVSDRLNAPELVNYFVAKAFVYNWDYFNDYLEPQTILDKRSGVCVHFAILGTHCMAKAGYEVINYSVFWGNTNYRTGHAVTVIKKSDGLLYIVVDSEKPGVIQGPYKTYDEIGRSIARDTITHSKLEANDELLYRMKGEFAD